MASMKAVTISDGDMAIDRSDPLDPDRSREQLHPPEVKLFTRTARFSVRSRGRFGT
jgi:hypothetical protein